MSIQSLLEGSMFGAYMDCENDYGNFSGHFEGKNYVTKESVQCWFNSKTPFKMVDGETDEVLNPADYQHESIEGLFLVEERQGSKGIYYVLDCIQVQPVEPELEGNPVKAWLEQFNASQADSMA